MAANPCIQSLRVVSFTHPHICSAQANPLWSSYKDEELLPRTRRNLLRSACCISPSLCSSPFRRASTIRSRHHQTRGTKHPASQRSQRLSNGRALLRGSSLEGLITTAYNLSYWQSSGAAIGPTRIHTMSRPNPWRVLRPLGSTCVTRWSIEDEHLREMLQGLLISPTSCQAHKSITP